jgi:uncharacterized membrane protein
MAFCPNCGASVDGRFCAKCGTPMPETAQSTPGSTPPPYTPQPAASGMTDNVASALCYALGFITGILFLVLAPYNQNRNVRFHAFQSIFLNIGVFVFSFALSILLGIFHFLGAIFGLFLVPLIWLGFFILWLYLMFSAYQNKKVVLPIIGPLAQQQA